MMKEACEKRTTNILDIPGKKYASIDDFTRVKILGVLPHFLIPLHSKYFFTALQFLLECTLKITRPKQTVSDATQFIS
jgi:hypothetical protein